MQINRPQFFSCLVAMALLLGAVWPCHAITEADLKAALFFKIAKFTRWPASAFKLPTSDLNLCVLGEDELSDSMKTLEDQLVHGRRLRVRSIGEPVDVLDDCQAVYVATNSQEQLEAVIGTVSKHPVLTVGDKENFRALGGILAFVLDENRMRFRINLSSAERSGLEFNAQLLQLAILDTDDTGESS